MIYFGFCECMKRYKELFLAALELAVVMFLTVVVISTLLEPMRRYLPFRHLLSGNGVCGILNGDEITDEKDLRKVLAAMNKVDDYLVCWETSFFEVEEERMYNGLAYDERLSEYHPMLASGEWFTDAKKRKGMLNAVVTDGGLGLSTGDCITVNNGYGECQIYICGELSRGASYFYPNHYSVDDSIFDKYKITEKQHSEGVGTYLLFAQDDAEKIGGNYALGPQIFVHYREDITTEELAENWKKLALAGFRGSDIEILREKTFTKLSQKIMVILPVAVAAIILVSLSLACFSAIRTRRQLRTYGIFFCCGMKWSGGLWMNVFHSVLSGILGFLLMFIARNVMIFFGFGKMILFSLEEWQLFGCLGILLYSTMLTVCIPAILIRRYQPVDVLRTARQ